MHWDIAKMIYVMEWKFAPSYVPSFFELRQMLTGLSIEDELEVCKIVPMIKETQSEGE